MVEMTNTSRWRSVGGGRDPARSAELTHNGVQALFTGPRVDQRAVIVQLLGIFRYIADPSLVRVLPHDIAAEIDRDVFDVLLSDGLVKTKAILSPELNHLVWESRVRELDQISVDAWEVVELPTSKEFDGDEVSSRRVCVVTEIMVLPSETKAKIVYASDRALSEMSPRGGRAAPHLNFFAHTHARDHAAFPLAGERLHYLSNDSDDYPLEWQNFFDHDVLTPAWQAVEWVEWNRRRRYCTDIFTPSDRVVHTIREANVMTSKRKRTGEDKVGAGPVPPMIGIVHFKSKLIHVGVPEVSNPFPFMFHLVLSDRDRSVEIAFFGSTAAKNFLIVQEGDVVQLQHYSIDRSEPAREGDKPKKLFIYPHLSGGVVSHVPEKYWKLLVTAGVLPAQVDGMAINDAAVVALRRRNRVHGIWLEPTFVTTVDVQHWDPSVQDEMDATFFDLVGVVSYVGRLERNRTLIPGSKGDLATVAVSESRWLKVIDRTSFSEMVIQIVSCSQPEALCAVKAGDVIMVTKLKWRNEREPPKKGFLEFAQTSLYSVIRRNEEVGPFQALEDCAAISIFASTLCPLTIGEVARGSMTVEGESWVEGDCIKNYSPLFPYPTWSDLTSAASGQLEIIPTAWTPSLIEHSNSNAGSVTLSLYTVQEVLLLITKTGPREHRQVLVSGYVSTIAPNLNPTGSSELECVLTDKNDPSVRCSAVARFNPLFRKPALPSPLEELGSEDTKALLRLLPDKALKALTSTTILRSTELPQFSPAKANSSEVEQPSTQDLSFETVKLQIYQHNSADGLQCSLHIYRTADDTVDTWIDAIHW